MRLIDADALEYHEIDEVGGEYNPYLGCSKAYIDRQPTIEPYQVGKWLQHSNPNYSPFDGSDEHIYQCVVCEKENAQKTRFCPCCGAKMENGR